MRYRLIAGLCYALRNRAQVYRFQAIASSELYDTDTISRHSMAVDRTGNVFVVGKSDLSYDPSYAPWLRSGEIRRNAVAESPSPQTPN